MSDSQLEAGPAEVPNDATSWLRGFDAAPEADRPAMLQAAIQSGSPAPEHLAPAAVALSQLLAERNQLPALRELMDLLAAKAPELNALLSPAWQQMLIQEALFAGRSEDLAALTAPLAAQHQDLPGEQWALLLDELAFYGHAGLAAKLAYELAEAIGEAALEDNEDLSYALEKHQVFAAMDAYWRSPRAETDHQGFLKALKAADLEEEDFDDLIQLRDRSEQAQISKLKQAFRERDLGAAQLPAQLAFSHWMRERYDLGIISSLAMLEQAFGLWEISPEAKRPEFTKWANISPKDFGELVSDLAHHEAHDAFVLLWGLPHVCDWLVATGLSNLLVSHHLLGLLPKARQALMHERAGSLWTSPFVHRWPRPSGSDEAAFAAEAERFTASHNRSEDLQGA